MVILGSRDLQAMTDVDKALLAAGIDDIVWHHAETEGAYELHVSDPADAERACAILSALWWEEPQPQPAVVADHAPQAAALPVWQQPAFAWGVGMAALLLAFYTVTGGSDTASLWYRRGVFLHGGGAPMEPWRWVTAATLHAHMAHASGNAAMALVMFWAAAERLGQGISTCVWLITAVAGFWVSAWWGPAVSVVGASGGLFGLWGAVCGHAWRYPTESVYKPRTRTVGAVTMLLGMMAFSHDADVAAHLGGCAAGLGLGLISPRKPLGILVQTLGALVAAAVIWSCWHRALGQNQGA